MSYLPYNLRYLRKKKQLTQAQLAEKIGVKRAVIGTYEEGKAEPRLNTLRLLARFFACNIHELVEVKMDESTRKSQDVSGQNLRVLPVVVDEVTQEETVPLVPVKAAAGYLSGFADPEYVGQLPQFVMPFPELSHKRSYRIFQTTGDSMLPVESGSYIIAEYVANWHDIQDFECYIVLTKNDGVVYKRLVNKVQQNHELLFISDNKEYKAYTVSTDEIVEVWKALGLISFKLPDSEQQFINLRSLNDILTEIRQDIKTLKPR
ncbi:helix-turn-helix domain-containing protein [bacterium]|nr:helix-turn-helix domain-containing protein [bacterium]